MEKIIRHFQGKINCQFDTNTCLQYVTGGQFTCRLSNKFTFFHYDLKE